MCDLLRAKYHFVINFSKHQISKGALRVWHEIVSSKEALCKGANYKLGNGFSFDPWRNPWVSRIQDHIPKLKEGVDGIV